MYGVMLAQTLITSFDRVLSIFVQQTFGWSSTRAGLLFLTITVPTLAAPLAGMLSDRCGPRWVAVAGFMLATAMLALLPLVSFNSFSQVLLLCVLLAMIGIQVLTGYIFEKTDAHVGCAFTLMITPLAADLASVVDQFGEENRETVGKVGAYGQAFSLLNCGISAGILAGPSLAVFLDETFGWRVMCWTLAVLSASAVVPIVVLVGSSVTIKGL